jgi:hypothetical protein
MMKQQNLNSIYGRETITTKFGNVSMVLDLCAIRTVFKEQESLTVWISDDDNKLPIRIKKPAQSSRRPKIGWRKFLIGEQVRAQIR